MNEPKNNHRTSHQTWKTGSGLLLSVALLLIGAAGSLSAQGWEWTYGSTDNFEDGRLRVIPVTQGCDVMENYTQTDGYIAVGNHAVGESNDIYVVRTDNAGASIWEKTYDITGNNDFDFGASIIELADGSGFAITGHVIYNSGTPIDGFILKIDCEGNIVWSNTYGRPMGQDWGNDIIEAATGNMTTTNPGDLVVCGVADGINGTVDGWLLRVTANGAIIWAQDYQVGGALDVRHDLFESLTELLPTGTNTTGDIIAVGHTRTDGGPFNAWATRVNGNTGAIGAAPQGMGTYANFSEFYSVEELHNPNEVSPGGNQNILMAGTRFGSQYFVKITGGDPCIVAGQSVIGSGTGNAFATTIREIRFPTNLFTGSANQWDIAVSGYGSFGTGEEALLTTISAATLNVAGISKRYGGAGNERAYSVFPVDAIGGRAFGFILCGYTDTDWQTDGDPGDLYLVKTDGFGSTGCENNFNPTHTSVTGSNCPTWSTATGTFSNNESTVDTEEDWGYQVCSNAVAKAAFSYLQDLPAFYPHTNGSALAIELPDYQSATSAILFDASGRKVSHFDISENAKSLQIEGLQVPSGMYYLMDANGTRIATIVSRQ